MSLATIGFGDSRIGLGDHPEKTGEDRETDADVQDGFQQEH